MPAHTPNNEQPIHSEPPTRLLSNEIQEIISDKQNWMVRNGIVLFLFIMGCLIGTTFFISYPDVVSVSATLTSVNAPKEVKVKTEGKLVKLNAVEGKNVSLNDVLGFMESTANHLEVLALSKSIDTLQQEITNKNYTHISSYFSESFQDLGEIQQSYQVFKQSFALFKQYLASGYFLRKKNMLEDDIAYLKRSHANLVQEKSIQQEDLGLEKETLDADQSLKDSKTISSFDYRSEKSKYINKALSIPRIVAAIISNESSQHEKQKEILQLENDIAQQKEIFIQSLNTFKAQLDEWKSRYLLKAPISGKIAFASFLQENQQLKINQTFCFINPENTQYFAEIAIPQHNLGKIKSGQKVLLKLPSHPFQEFGTLLGKLDFISKIPSDSGYFARVILPNGLRTNYQKQIQYRDGLTAQGEIVTTDTKLSDRLLYQFTKLMTLKGPEH